MIKSPGANVRQEEPSKKKNKEKKEYVSSIPIQQIALCKPRSLLIQAPELRSAFEGKIRFCWLNYGFRFMFCCVGVGLCPGEIKGPGSERSRQKCEARTLFNKRICFLSPSVNQFTWNTISIVGLKSISAKCLALHWWLDELNWEQSVIWESPHSPDT